MPPKYKLIYFNARRTAEPVRFLLKYGNIDFEDTRINREDEWPQLKNSTPFGQLLLLEHDGQTINQSVAICRYVAKLVKLAGNDEWEDLEIDAVVDTISDLRQKVKDMYLEEDSRKSRTLERIAYNGTLHLFLSRLDRMVEGNQGFLVLGRLTWADLYFTAIFPSIEWFIGVGVLGNYPNLLKLTKRIIQLPAIKKWLEERPPTDS